MTIKIIGINGGIRRTFDEVTYYDFSKYPIVEFTSIRYNAKALLKVPDGYYITTELDESEVQNES